MWCSNTTASWQQRSASPVFRLSWRPLRRLKICSSERIQCMYTYVHVKYCVTWQISQHHTQSLSITTRTAMRLQWNRRTKSGKYGVSHIFAHSFDFSIPNNSKHTNSIITGTIIYSDACHHAQGFSGASTSSYLFQPYLNTKLPWIGIYFHPVSFDLTLKPGHHLSWVGVYKRRLCTLYLTSGIKSFFV